MCAGRAAVVTSPFPRKCRGISSLFTRPTRRGAGDTLVLGLARLNSDGTLDTTFATDGKETTSFGGQAFARGAALQPDGNIVLAGSWRPGDVFSTQWAAARYLGGLTNNPGAPATLTVVAGNNQSAAVGTAFATALQAVVTDSFGNVIPGVSVTFAAPASGAGGSFAGSATVTTDARGVATAPAFTANTIAGSYNV